MSWSSIIYDAILVFFSSLVIGMSLSDIIEKIKNNKRITREITTIVFIGVYLILFIIRYTLDLINEGVN